MLLEYDSFDTRKIPGLLDLHVFEVLYITYMSVICEANKSFFVKEEAL